MYLRWREFVGTSKLHDMVDVRLDIFTNHMKSFVRTFFSSLKTASNAIFVHKKRLYPQIDHILLCYIKSLTSESIKKLSRVRTRSTYIL